MREKLFLLLIIASFLLVSCASQQIQKQATLDKLGTFKFNERKHIYGTLDELANRLKASRNCVVLEKKEIKIDGKVLILELRDIDGDGKAEQFVLYPDMQDFGFIFDLNKDGRADYIVFDRGLATIKNKKFYWSKYHWIDSNFDGKIDIHVTYPIDLDGDKFPDQGVTGWIYDSNYDGYIDKGEYLGENFQEPMEKIGDDFFMKGCPGAFKFDKKDFSFENKILSHINSRYP